MNPPHSSVAGAEDLVLLLLYQLIVIILVTRIVASFCRKFLGQTEVAGEVLAGLILGPSLLGAIAPQAMAHLFHPATVPVFTGISQIGLIFLMFQIGLEFEFKSNVSTSWFSVIMISASGIVVPFTLGYFSAPWFYAQMDSPLPQELGFRLFFATAMSITALPVLGRIFLELNLSQSRTAAVTIASAAIDDVSGWLILGAISSMIVGQFLFVPVVTRIVLLVLYVLLIFMIARPWIRQIVRAHLEEHRHLSQRAIAFILIALFVSAAITSNLGVFAIIGGFIIGVALHEEKQLVSDWKNRITPLVNTFFLPLFFAYTGLRTNIGLLSGKDEIIECLLVCAVAFLGKLGGCYIAARISGESNRSAFTIGVCMNTRGLMELIAINIGYDLGVLPPKMFTILVIMALASTYMATPLIRILMAKEQSQNASA